MKRFIDIIKTNDASKFRSTVGMLGNSPHDYAYNVHGIVDDEGDDCFITLCDILGIFMASGWCIKMLHLV